jgi:hypothetical protein
VNQSCIQFCCQRSKKSAYSEYNTFNISLEIGHIWSFSLITVPVLRVFLLASY